jgi:hypothetical protein
MALLGEKSKACSAPSLGGQPLQQKMKRQGAAHTLQYLETLFMLPMNPIS